MRSVREAARSRSENSLRGGQVYWEEGSEKEEVGS